MVPKLANDGSDRAIKNFFFVLFVLAVFLIGSCSWTAMQEKTMSPGRCLPFFPDQDGWYGGDAAYSIALDDQRTLWLFGDTFAACEAWRQDRVGMDVVLGTTVGISTCSKNKFHITYYLKYKGGKFVSSFGDNEWLWPQDPFLVQGVLYIPLMIVTPTDKTGGMFHFRISGHKFAKIRDFSAVDPHRWPYEWIDYSDAIPQEIIAFATTSVVKGSYVYFYPLYVHSAGQESVMGNILARIPVDKIDKPQGAVEYFTKEGAWVKEVKPKTVKIVLGDAVSELSVRYHAADQKWIAVYLSTQNKGNQLIYQVADTLEGPWDLPKVLMEPIPEVDSRSRFYHENNFCYAGKEHIEFSNGNNIVATYVCNSSEDLEKEDSFIRKNLFLYRPVVREINLK